MPLQKQVHVLRQFSTNPIRSRDLVNRCFAEAIDRPEPAEQQTFPVLAHTGAVIENTFFDPFFHQQLMICVGEPMRLVADALKQTQGRGIHWKLQRQGAARSINLLAFLRQADNRKFV
jgi:hypothetical protein